MPIVSQTRIFNLCSALAGYLTCAPIEQVTGIDPMKGGGSSKLPPPKKQKGMSDFFRAKPKRTETEIQQSQEEDRAVVKGEYIYSRQGTCISKAGYCALVPGGRTLSL